jgi:hypothetical protein
LKHFFTRRHGGPYNRAMPKTPLVAAAAAATLAPNNDPIRPNPR